MSIIGRIIQSEAYPELVSLRGPDGENIRRLLTDAEFMSGELVEIRRQTERREEVKARVTDLRKASDSYCSYCALQKQFHKVLGERRRDALAGQATLDEANNKVIELQAALSANAKMLARQCDLARDAETERDKAETNLKRSDAQSKADATDAHELQKRYAELLRTSVVVSGTHIPATWQWKEFNEAVAALAK